MNLDRILKIGQIIALVVVPIWILSELTTSNKLMLHSFEEMKRVQAQIIETLVVLNAKVDTNTRTLAVNEGIRIGRKELDAEQRLVRQ